jgi:O-antigen ligase
LSVKTAGSDLLGRRRPEALAPSPVTSAAERPRGRRARAGDTPPHSALVWIFIAYLALDYLRPPALQALKLQMLFVLTLPLLWLFSKQRVWSTNLTLTVVFIATGAVMLPFARNNYEIYHYTRVMSTYLVSSLAATWLMGYRRYFHRVVWSFAAIMCVQAVYAMLHEGRGYGDFLGDENDLAIACVMLLPFGVVGFQQLSGLPRWLCGALAGLMILGVGASFSRGGFLGLAAAAGYCLFFGRHRVRNLLLGVTAAVLLFALAPASYKGEMSTIQNTETGTAETRFFLWTAATRIWLDYPIMGVGGYNTKYRIGEYQPKGGFGDLFEAREFHERDWSGLAIHSLYFELLADRGLVGVGLFAAIAFLHYRTCVRLRRAAQEGRLPGGRRRDVYLFALALEASMTGFLTAGAFLSMATYPHFWFLSAQAVALDRWARRPAATPPTGASAR